MELLYLIGAILVLFLFVKFFSLSMKIVYNGLLGVILLWVLNIPGSWIGFTLNITIINALIAGFFGVPGVLFLIVWKLLF